MEKFTQAIEEIIGGAIEQRTGMDTNRLELAVQAIENAHMTAQNALQMANHAIGVIQDMQGQLSGKADLEQLGGAFELSNSLMQSFEAWKKYIQETSNKVKEEAQKRVELRVTKKAIEWRQTEEDDWKQLIALDMLKGERGARGTAVGGAKGDTGATGAGVESGGTTGQYLMKSSATDYDTEWSTPALSEFTEDGNHQTVTGAEKSTWNNKQDELISGVNIKTINSTSLLGSGDIPITDYTNEMAQDAVGGILTDTSTIDFTYNDSLGMITADVKLGYEKFHGIETAGALSFDNSTHVLTVAGTVTYWFLGERYSTASPITCDLDSFVTLTDNTLYFFYFDTAAGTLKANNSYWNMKTVVPVATVYWNGAAGALNKETHGYTRDVDWHLWAHLTVGTRYTSGLDLTYPSIAVDGSLQVETGVIYDEDLSITTGLQTSMRGWFKTDASTYSWATYALPYLGTAGAPVYLDTDTYLLTTFAANRYVCYWVYATTDADYPIQVVPSHVSAPYILVSLARAEVAPVFTNMGLNPEWKLIHRYIFAGNGQFQESTDYRTQTSLAGGTSTAINAGSVYFNPSGTITSTTVQTAIEELDTEKAPAASGVTNGDTHDHSGGDGAQIAYSTLSGLPTIPDQLSDLSDDATHRLVTDTEKSTWNGKADGSHTQAETTITFTDVATNNSSTSAHGFLPKLSNVAGQFLNGVGAWSAPAGGGDVIAPASNNDTYIPVWNGVDSKTLANGIPQSTFAPASHSQAESSITFTDVATGNASTGSHGYEPKATAPAAGNLNVLGIENGATARTDKLLLDTTTPSTQAYGDSAAAGSGVKAARVDHKHAMPAALTDATIATTDVTTNNASTSKHGWLVKATAPASGLYNYVGITNGETVYTNKALFDATVPSTQAYGDAAATGSAVVASRRDHVHAMPAALTDATIATTNVTTNNATTSKHGWLLKATAPASGLYNYVGITNGETAYTNKALFDATVPSTQAFGDAAATGSATVAARRDHKHAMMAAPTLAGLGGVAASLYDAHTVLYATTNDTPAALTVAEQKVVGRITGGNISALSLSGADATVISGTEGTGGNLAMWNADGDLVDANISTGAWASWTPTIANFTTGSATVDAKYCQIGKTVHARLKVTLAADSSVSGAMSFSLPVTRTTESGAAGKEIIGNVEMFDNNVGPYSGVAICGTSTSCSVLVNNTAGTYAVPTLTSSTVPFTWTTDDSFSVYITYEAA